MYHVSLLKTWHLVFWRFVDFGVLVWSSVVTQLARISDDRPLMMKRLQEIVKVCMLMFCARGPSRTGISYAFLGISVGISNLFESFGISES